MSVLATRSKPRPPAALPAAPPALNFVVVGDVRSGSAAVQSALAAAPGVVCHQDLLHPSDAVRRACHERYFGPGPDDVPEWCMVGGMTNPIHYLNRRVFDSALRGERAIGVRTPYPRVRSLELDELFADRCRAGDFCVIHVVRNPIACLVSLKQAQKSRTWARRPGEPHRFRPPAPVALDPEEVTHFVRDHEAIRGRVGRCCDDAMTLPYRDLVLDFRNAMRGVHEFLELPTAKPAPPELLRLRNRPIRDRISGLPRLAAALPRDVRARLDDPDLF